MAEWLKCQLGYSYPIRTSEAANDGSGSWDPAVLVGDPAEAANDVSSSWVPAVHVGDLACIPGSFCSLAQT